jgi:hypothetical protein
VDRRQQTEPARAEDRAGGEESRDRRQAETRQHDRHEDADDSDDRELVEKRYVSH